MRAPPHEITASTIAARPGQAAPRTLADVLHLEVQALEEMGYSVNDLMPGVLACAVSYIAAKRGPAFAAAMCDRAAAELRGVFHA